MIAYFYLKSDKC